MISVRSKPTSPTSLRGENDFGCEVNLQVGRHCEGIAI